MKKSMGQFYTTQSEKILQGLSIPPDVHVIEPFVGKGDLLPFIGARKRDIYDIDSPLTKTRDTILNPPDYSNSYVVTNPPYVARNKSANKAAFDKYGVNDLYKCFLKEFQTNPPLGGVLIIPLNFWCSVRLSDVQLRRDFLRLYSVTRMNVFEERVFDDTSATVCAFEFARGGDSDMEVVVFPSREKFRALLCAANNFSFGGEIYELPSSGRYTITRLTSKTKEESTNIRVKCIDDSATSRIRWEVGEKYVDNTPKSSARSFATLVVAPPIDGKTQARLCEACNVFLEGKRVASRSLFLPNYRESNDIARKRISFELVYRITAHVLDSV